MPGTFVEPGWEKSGIESGAALVLDDAVEMAAAVGSENSSTPMLWICSHYNAIVGPTSS
jgi:hypothetical protein